MQVELRLNAQVACADGPAGRLTDLVLDPTSEQVTHLVVEMPGFGHPRHLVPAVLLQPSAGREVRLRCSRAELARTEFFTETESVPLDASDAWLIADGALAWPLAFPEVARLLAERERVPPGELALHRDTAVEASDGPLGRLAAFVLQSNDDRVVDVIVRRGHLWRQQDVVIPANSIDSIDALAVHLRLSKARIKMLPTSPPGSAA
jgi:sporulation protein YlmC with PRC-barrel domain